MLYYITYMLFNPKNQKKIQLAWKTFCVIIVISMIALYTIPNLR